MHDRVARFVTDALAGRPVEDFGRLALALHAWQAARDPVIAALSTGEPRAWTDIPAVPVALFKRLDVGTVHPDAPGVVFRTSGTTKTGRGVHRLRDTRLYDLNALGWFRESVPDAPGEVVGVLDDPGVSPDASLSHMVALFPHSGGRATWHQRDGRVDVASLAERLATARPSFVATTAFGLAAWLDAAPTALPAGSVLMVTGGFKGRTHRLDGDALYTEVRDVLRPTRIVTEYGMTELSSQLWGTPTTAYRPPPWLRAVAVDPATGAPLPAGVAGQLRFVDLCNVDSTVAIETMDEGVVHGDGTVTLYGRLAGAPPRGCSLTVADVPRAALP